MPKKASLFSSLFEGVTLSEPLKVFKSNVEAIGFIGWKSLGEIDRENKRVRKLEEEATSLKRDWEKLIKGAEETLGQFRSVKMRLRGDEFKDATEQADKQMKKLKGMMVQGKRWVGPQGVDAGPRELIEYLEKTQEVLMPMLFVFLVTIWDAFILDTARRILGIHPSLITGGNQEIRVSAAFAWNIKNPEDMRNYLIEEKVRYLDGNREELLKCYREYWGIDWEKSGIALSEVIEIRARRDIWVHNKGIVNRQYLNMVGKGRSLKEGQVAQIDGEYLTDCLVKLTKLAVYIHNIAHKKHYAKTDVG